MYDQLVNEEYQLPVDIGTEPLIKAGTLAVALALNDKVQQAEKAAIERIELETQQAVEQINKEKEDIVDNLAQQIKQFTANQQEALSQVEQACHSILSTVLTRFHCDMSALDKLNFSVRELITAYRHKDDITLVVRSFDSWQQCGIPLPTDWEVKEDPAIETECLLSMSNGAIVCDFDAIFQKMTEEIVSVDY